MQVVIPTKAHLDTLSLQGLTDFYNEAAVSLGDRQVKSFRDKPTALGRANVIRMRLEFAQKVDREQEEDAAPSKTAEKPAVEVEKKNESAKVKAETAERKRRGYRFVFAPRPVNEQRPPREGCRRRILFDLLDREEGTTHAEVMKAVSLTERQAYEAIRLIHYVHGFGLRQDDTTGRVWLRRK